MHIYFNCLLFTLKLKTIVFDFCVKNKGCIKLNDLQTRMYLNDWKLDQWDEIKKFQTKLKKKKHCMDNILT